MTQKKLLQTVDGVTRCFWPGDHADYIHYHDNEWGHPVSDDQRLFEKICLEGFQSGLSWLTILRKRDAFRRAFRDFDFHAVARLNARSVNRLVKDASIIRHRGKIESTINNAKRAIELVEEAGSLAAFFWQFEPEPDAFDVNRTQTPESTALSKSLKQRGWSFVGPTTAYAFMQSMGMVNDHVPGCAFRKNTTTLRKEFVRPS